MASLKSLAKDTAIYGLSSIIGRFLNYLLVPLYTAKISAVVSSTSFSYVLLRLTSTDSGSYSAPAKKSATTLVPDAIRKVAGMYYRIGLIGDNSSSVTWPNLLAPEGWRVPELQDFVNLAKASLDVCDYLEVLRCPEVYPSLQIGDKKLKKDLMNSWGMNMAPCGTNRDGSLYIKEFGDLDGLHMVFAINSVSQFATLEIAAATAKGGARAIALGKNAPIVVRLIYTGDDK